MKTQTKQIADFRNNLKREGFVDVTCYFELKPKQFMISDFKIVDRLNSVEIPVKDNGECILSGRKYLAWKVLQEQRRYNFENRTSYSIEWDDLDTIKTDLLSKGFVPLTCVERIDPKKYFVNKKGIVLIVKGKNVGDEPPRNPIDEYTCFYRLVRDDGYYKYFTNKELVEMQFGGNNKC